MCVYEKLPITNSNVSIDLGDLLILKVFKQSDDMEWKGNAPPPPKEARERGGVLPLYLIGKDIYVYTVP